MVSRSRSLAAVIIIVAIPVVFTAVGTQTSAAAKSHKPHWKTVTVKIVTDANTIGRYSPHKVTVHVGQKIVFKNVSDAHHTVTADNLKTFNSPDVPTGKSWSYTPKKVGRIKYFCVYHALMHGIVVVKK